MRSRTPLQRSCLILRSGSKFSWYRRPRSIVVAVVRITEVGLRHREPDSGEKLKARVAKVCRDSGPLVQNAGQAQRQDGRNPFAPLLARKIRERSIRHGILHRVSEEGSETASAHPGYGCRLGENGRKDSNGKATQMSADPHASWCGKGARQRASLPDLSGFPVVASVCFSR